MEYFFVRVSDHEDIWIGYQNEIALKCENGLFFLTPYKNGGDFYETGGEYDMPEHEPVSIDEAARFLSSNQDDKRFEGVTVSWDAFEDQDETLYDYYDEYGALHFNDKEELFRTLRTFGTVVK